MQVIQKHVSVLVVVVVVRPGAVFQQDMAGHAQLRREGRRLAGVVRLRGPLRHHQIRAHRLRLGHQELQLAGLVAPRRKAGAVIALDPDLWPAQLVAQSVKTLQRCRQMRQEDTGKPGEMHHAVLLKLARCNTCKKHPRVQFRNSPDIMHRMHIRRR